MNKLNKLFLKISILTSLIFSITASADPIDGDLISQKDLVEIYRNSEGLFVPRVKKEGYKVFTEGETVKRTYLECIGNYEYVTAVISTETGGATIYRYSEAEERPSVSLNARSIRNEILNWKSFTLGKITYNSDFNVIDMDNTSDNEYDNYNCSKIISI